MERHECPLCGRPHNVKQGLSDVARAKKAAAARWAKEQAPRRLVKPVARRAPEPVEEEATGTYIDRSDSQE